jgi:hypothetical protein
LKKFLVKNIKETREDLLLEFEQRLNLIEMQLREDYKKIFSTISLQYFESQKRKEDKLKLLEQFNSLITTVLDPLRLQWNSTLKETLEILYQSKSSSSLLILNLSRVKIFDLLSCLHNRYLELGGNAEEWDSFEYNIIYAYDDTTRLNYFFEFFEEEFESEIQEMTIDSFYLCLFVIFHLYRIFLPMETINKDFGSIVTKYFSPHLRNTLTAGFIEYQYLQRQLKEGKQAECSIQ